jgi:hypothetical protein
MIQHYLGAKLTPTQAAKLIVAELGVNWWVWDERYIIDVEVLTDAERAKIDTACSRQCERMIEFLGTRNIPKMGQ